MTLREAAQEFHAVTTRRRLVERFFAERFAKLVVSMSMSKALDVLGVPPGVQPTAEEISKAYKAKARVVHPDVGGSHEEMLELNAAKEVLDRYFTQNTPRQRPEPKKKIQKGRDFNVARSQVPTNIEWKFRSVYMFGKPSDYVEEQQADTESGTKGLLSYVSVWVCYGQTSSQHVFMLMEHAVPNPYSDLLYDDWCMESMETYPLSQDISKLAPKAIKSLVTKGRLSTGIQRIATKYLAMSKLVETEIERRSGGVNLKDILIGTGLVSGASSESQSRKTIVELAGKLNDARYKADRAKPRGERIQYNSETWPLYDFTLYVNGKPFPLSQKTIENLNAQGSRGGLFWMAVYSRMDYEFDRRRVITKIPGYGTKLLEMIEDSLYNEPPQLTVMLLKAIEEAEGVKKATMAQSVVARFLEAEAAKVDPKRKKIIMAIYNRSSSSDRSVRGGKHHVMLVGKAAKGYGVKDYTPVVLEDLSEDELEKLAKAVA